MFARHVTHNEVLGELYSPLLIIHGEADNIMLSARTEHFSELTPNAQISFYP